MAPPPADQLYAAVRSFYSNTQQTHPVAALPCRLAKKHKDESVEAGREYVEAYVAFVHYVEELHNMISGDGGHH